MLDTNRATSRVGGVLARARHTTVQMDCVSVGIVNADRRAIVELVNLDAACLEPFGKGRVAARVADFEAEMIKRFRPLEKLERVMSLAPAETNSYLVGIPWFGDQTHRVDVEAGHRLDVWGSHSEVREAGARQLGAARRNRTGRGRRR